MGIGQPLDQVERPQSDGLQRVARGKMRVKLAHGCGGTEMNPGGDIRCAIADELAGGLQHLGHFLAVDGRPLEPGQWVAPRVRGAR